MNGLPGVMWKWRDWWIRWTGPIWVTEFAGILSEGIRALAVVQRRQTNLALRSEDLSKIFGHGFTTRHGGHGFGLHSPANAARALGGYLAAHSDGPGSGATFTLELPVFGRTRDPH